MRNEPAYILTHDVARFEHYETGYNADLLIENVPMNDRLRIFQDRPLEVPDPIIYRGYPPIIETLDFPVADNSWLVMSGRMIDALRSAGEFSHREYPIVVADSRHSSDEWLDRDGGLRDDMVIRGFAAVQLRERLDIFDFDKSTFKHDPDFPDFIGDVSEYVFKIPVQGLPPIFHINGEPVKAFISHAGRIALKAAGIRGVEYISLKGIQGGEGMFVDNPVPLPLDG